MFYKLVKNCQISKLRGVLVFKGGLYFFWYGNGNCITQKLCTKCNKETNVEDLECNTCEFHFLEGVGCCGDCNEPICKSCQKCHCGAPNLTLDIEQISSYRM